MTEQQIRESYIKLYNATTDHNKYSDLEQLRTEAEQLGLKDWVQLIEARLAAVDVKYDVAIDLSNSILSYDKISTELRAWTLINRGFAYNNLDLPRIEDGIADYTAVIEMSEATSELKACALNKRGAAYVKLKPRRAKDAISDCTAVIEMNEATLCDKATALINRGNAFCLLEPPRTEDGIADYTAIIQMNDATVEDKAKALINRGIVYGRLEPPRTEDKIADYTAVIEMSDALAEQKAGALFNRGRTYGELEPPRTEDEIVDYTAVIEISDASAKQKAKALINRGIVYRRLEPPRTEEAIADYTAVIEMSDAPVEQKAKAFYLRGIIYKEKGETKEAKSYLLEAKKAFAEIGSMGHVRQIDFMLSRLDVPKEDLSQEDKEIIEAVSTTRSSDEPDSIEKKIIDKFAAKKTTVYEEYNKQKSSTYIKDGATKNEVILAILKGWGSAVPLVLGGEGACRGGGYFLKYNGNGLAVDPGHDYLKNFHDQKFHLREVDGVLVSHNHADHTHDLKSIDDVKYEMWINSEEKPNPYSLILDNDTASSTQEWSGEDKPFRKRPIRVDANRNHDTIDLCDEAGLPFKVNSFKAQHSKDVPNAVGYRVSCMKDKEQVLSVGFSCDTGYDKKLFDENNLIGCDILVAHMSQPSMGELENPKGAPFKKGHLGYRGTVELIKQCEPRLTIVSEFWAGLDDTRILLLQGLRNRCGTENILPGGVGLLIKAICEPKRFEILCTNCKKWTAHDKITVGSSSAAFGPLNYLCPDCCL